MLNSRSNPGDRRPRGPHLDEHTALDLLQGLLTHEEVTVTLAHVADCDRCERRFQAVAALEARMEATRSLQVFPDGRLVLERRAEAPVTSTAAGSDLRLLPIRFKEAAARALRPVHFRWIGALATAVILLLILWPRAVGPPHEPQVHLLPVLSFRLETRDMAAPGADDLHAGLDAYQRRDFARAVEHLKRAAGAELDEVQETIRRIYLGSSLAWMARHAEAVTALEAVPYRVVPEDWGWEAQWTLYVALLRSGREARADSLLEILAAKPGRVGDRARGLRPATERE